MPTDRDEKDERLEEILENSFVEGQQAIADKRTARRAAERAEELLKSGQVAVDVIDRANQLAEDGDPYKKKLAEVIKNAVVGGVHGMATPVQGEGRGVLETSPFSKSWSESGTALPDSTKGLPKPQPRKRGRPPKPRPE